VKDTNLADGNQNGTIDYWTRGEGLAKWALTPTPYTALTAALRAKKIPEKYVNGLAAKYFRAVFGLWPGQRKD
jgi:hypothetical protein